MKSISFAHALVGIGLLTLMLALVTGLLTIPWLEISALAMGTGGMGPDRGPVDGPSVVAPTSVLIATIVVGLATLCWGLGQARGDGARQELTFAQALVVVGLLGLGITGALAMWPAFFMAASDWCEGVHALRPFGTALCSLADSMRGYQVLHLGFEPPPSYTRMLVAQLVAVPLPLLVLGEGLRRLRRDRIAGGPAGGGLARSHVVVVLALFSFITACAAAPTSVESIEFAVGLSGGWEEASLVIPEIATLGVGCAAPLVILFLVAIGHRWGRGPAAAWLPVATALLTFALAGATAADPGDTGRAGSLAFEYVRLTVVGIALAGLVWGALVSSVSRDEPGRLLSLGQVLGVVALVGFMLLGSVTRGAVNTFETLRLSEVTHTWLIVTLAIAYVVNLGILAAAVWRLQVERPDEPVPEPEGA